MVQRLDYGATEARSWKTETQSPGDFSLNANRHRGISEEQFSGVLLDDFHKRKNSGELLPYTRYTSLSHKFTSEGTNLVSIDLSDQNGTLWRTQWRWAGGVTLPLTERNVLFQVGKTNVVDQVLRDLGIDRYIYPQRAAAKLYSRGWDGLTFLAELHKTVRMFRGVGTQIVRLVRDYRRYVRSLRRYKDGGQVILLTFNQWLQGRYGWRILLYDIEDINRTIREMDEKSLTRVKETVGDSFYHVVDSSRSEAYFNYTNNVSDISEYEVGVRGSIIADFLPSKISLNPIVTAWELIPFSFVIDWFLNVGRALEALSFLTLNNQYTASYGIYCGVTRQISYEVVANPGRTIISSNWELNKHAENWEYKQRHPVVVSTIPRMDINLDGFKVTDLIALVLQVLANLSRR